MLPIGIHALVFLLCLMCPAVLGFGSRYRSSSRRFGGGGFGGGGFGGGGGSNYPSLPSPPTSNGEL